MSNNWWANKLGTTPQPQQPNNPQPVYQQPVYQPPQQSYPTTQQQAPIGELCPECRSGNYGGATPEARKRCYDCGYPIQQSGSGLGKGITSGPQPTGSPVPAKQVQAGGFNPSTIIGHI
jgi:hypothetical protein